MSSQSADAEPSGTSPDAVGPGGAVRIGLADVVVAVLVGFLVAVAVYGAVGNLLGLPPYLQAARIPVPWVPLVAAVVAPIALYVGALVLGRRRTSFARTLILVVALAANSALGITLYFLALSAVPV